MNPIRHPKDFSSLDVYISELRRVKEDLTKRLLLGLKSGTCVKQIDDLLKYINVMLFWANCTILYGSSNFGVTPGVEDEGNPTDPTIPNTEEALLIDTINYLLIDTTHKLLL